MWIAFNVPNRGTGWMSIVAKDRDEAPSGTLPDSEVSVRFRRLEDAKMLFPLAQIVHTPFGDYHYRAFVTRKKLGSMLATLVTTMDYDNFKDAIPEEDPDMKRVANFIWVDALNLQEANHWSYDLAQE